MLNAPFQVINYPFSKKKFVNYPYDRRHFECLVHISLYGTFQHNETHLIYIFRFKNKRLFYPI